MKLYPHQQGQVDAIVSQAKAKRNRLVIGSATGTGKSVTIAELCKLARRPLVIAPTLNLMYQMHETLVKVLGEDIDIEQGDRRVSRSSMHRTRCVLASRDSLTSNERYKKFSDRTLVICDECHLGNSEQQVITRKFYEENGATIVGLTATPFTSSGKKLDYWSEPCWYKSLQDFINEGQLCKVKATLLEPKSFDYTIFDELKFTEYNIDELYSEESTAQEVVNAVLQLYNHQPSAVYLPGLKAMHRTAEVFGRFGVPVSVVWGNQPLEDRLVNMEAFKNGETKVILNVGVLAYGWDFPELRNIFSASPTRSLPKKEQEIGRLVRPLKGVINPDMTPAEKVEAIAKSDKPYGHYYDLTHTLSEIKLASAVDVFARIEDDEQRKRVMKRVEDNPDSDIMEEITDEKDRIAKEEAKAKEREKVLIGMSFNRQGHDLFDGEAVPKQRGWRVFYGQFRGQLLREVPSGVLRSHLRKTKRGTPYATALASEIARRQVA